MIQERYFPSFFKKVTPQPKLWLTLGLILSILLIKNVYYGLAIMIVSIIMIYREKQMGLFKLIIVTMVVMFVSMYALHGAIAPNINPSVDVPLFSIFGIKYYASGFRWATKYYMRIGPLMPALFLIFLSIDFADLSVVMCQAGLSYNAVFTFVDSFQVITILGKDMNQIRDAQRARGLKMEGNVIQRLKAFVPVIVPVVAGAIVRVQDQAIAMDTKGFNIKGKKTIYRELVPYKWDPLFKWTGIFMAVYAILYRVLIMAHIISPFLTNML